MAVEYNLSFDPAEIRDQNGPDFRKPVKILHANREIGYFRFSDDNIFQIWLYADYFNQPGWRELLLEQTFSHEVKCRDWLTRNIDLIMEGLKVHPLD